MSLACSSSLRLMHEAFTFKPTFQVKNSFIHVNDLERDTSYRSRSLSEYSGMLAQEEISALLVQHQESSVLRRLEALEKQDKAAVLNCIEAQDPAVVLNCIEAPFENRFQAPLDSSSLNQPKELANNSSGYSDDMEFLSANISMAHDQQPVETTDIADEFRTTVMMRDLPNSYSSQTLEELFNEHGFQGRYDFLYLPIDFRTGASLGYAFANFVRPRDAKFFMEYFEGFSRWCIQSPKVCHVTWSAPNQGLECHVQSYRNSPVMHDSLPDEYKPRLYQAGVRIAFPKPTKSIRKPRIRPAKCRNVERQKV